MGGSCKLRATIINLVKTMLGEKILLFFSDTLHGQCGCVQIVKVLHFNQTSLFNMIEKPYIQVFGERQLRMSLLDS